LQRLYPEARKIQRKLQTIKRVATTSRADGTSSTCISAIMELVNELTTVEGRMAAGASPRGIPAPLLSKSKTLALLLAPFAPYLARTLEILGEEGSLLRHRGRKYDPALARRGNQRSCEINGKLRSRITMCQRMRRKTLSGARAIRSEDKSHA
jgi:leucyl-tRNA synthetase